MHENTNDLRILALDLRTERFGFAVLQGPCELLDWGVRRLRPISMNDGAVFIRWRVSPLIKLYLPSVIVVKTATRNGGGRKARREYLLDTVREEAHQWSTELVLIDRMEIRRAFATSGGTTKEAIAARIAPLFPELTWNLPPVRRPWTPEAHSISIFDAVSLGLTYFARFKDIFPDERPEA